MITQVTPGLFGIAKKTPVAIIKSKWADLIYPPLKNEASLHNIFFLVIPYVVINEGNSNSAFDSVVPILRDKGFLSNDSQDAGAQLPIFERMFDIYWQIGLEPMYWEPSCYQVFAKHIPFDRALQLWTDFK
ncbi:MAG: hypothetical protein QM730_27040 [Anaerolineales bacterium]